MGSRASVTDSKGCQAVPKKERLKTDLSPEQVRETVKVLARNREIIATEWQLYLILGLNFAFIEASALIKSIIYRSVVEKLPLSFFSWSYFEAVLKQF